MGIASDFVLIVIAGLLGGMLARLLRLPLLVGYVAAGVVVGPYTAGPTVVQIHDVELLAEIGVALLLFSIGLEISLRDLQPVRRVALIGGPIQVIGTCAAGALAAIYALRMPVTEAIWFGAMISVSSTMVVLKTLSSAGVMSTLASRVMIGLLVVQDLAVIPMLIILPQLGAMDGIVSKLARSLAIAAAFLFAVAFLGTRLFPRLLKLLLAWGSRELFLVAVVATGVGVGYATHAVGLSFALGAFVAGIILSESEFSHQALSDVVSLRDVFGLLFFVTVGMLFDPRYAITHAGQIAGAVALILLGKAVISGVIARVFGYTNMAPWIVGLGLSQIGEFSFVLARSGFSANLISKSTYDLTLTCAVLTMALSPLVSSLALPLGRAWRGWRKSLPVRTIEISKVQMENHVIIAGYGRTGSAVARALSVAGVPSVIVEINHPLLADLTAAGYTGIWGDITSNEVLHAARVEHARMLLLTVPDQNTVHLAIERAHHLNPTLILIARAVQQHHVAELSKLGVVAAIQPEFEGGIEMVRQALIRCRREEPEVRGILDTLRREIYGA